LSISKNSFDVFSPNKFKVIYQISSSFISRVSTEGIFILSLVISFIKKSLSQERIIFKVTFVPAGHFI
jgi:hypothetical protein